MSDINQARRVRAEIFFQGVDITRSLEKYLISVTYTDNEEDETDDLQIRIHDRDGIWLENWLVDALEAADRVNTSAPPITAHAAVATAKMYKVMSNTGLYVRSGPGGGYGSIGTLVWGAQITVKSISGGWACIDFRGKTGYVSAQYISEILVSNPAGWAFGERVVVSGQPQYSSYGAGTTGAAVSNYAGYITGLNLGSGIKYPIHVDQLGWFAESQTRRDSAGTGSGGTASVQQRVPGFTIQTKFIRENWRGDGKDEVLDCGQFELDAVTVEGPPDVINIKATSLPYGTQIRQTEKNRAWESVSLSEIAGEIARGGGMTCMYESAFNPFYDRQEQIKTSDIKFLSGLCRRAGLSLKVTNNIIVIFEQAAFEKKPPVFHIQKGDGSYSRYKLDTRETGTRYDSCLVSYTDPANGRKIEAVAYADGAGSASLTRPTLRIGDRGEDVRYMQRLLADRGFRQRSGIDGIFGADTKESVRLFQKSINMRGDGVCGPKTWEALELSASPSSNLSVNGQQLRITAKVSSIAEAKTLAEKLLRLKNKSGLPANYTIPFHPGWVAGITGTLGGWGTWDGKYIVSQSRHTVGGSNSSTQISLRQVLEGY